MSPRQRRRRQEKEIAASLSSEGQHDRISTRDKSDGSGRRGQATGGRGDAATSPPDKTSCPICMDTLTNPKTLSECKHTFCTACIDKAMKVSIQILKFGVLILFFFI